LFHHLLSKGKDQVESTNKAIGLLLIKLVNDKRINWDEHLYTILYVYMTTFKVITSHTLLVYGLHPMMHTKYLLGTTNSQTSKDFAPIKVLINRLSKLERLDESSQQVVQNKEKHQ
jgi:hypothetical protein